VKHTHQTQQSVKMGDEVSPQEIVEIVTGFLLNSPPGEFMEVVTDVRGLLSDESLLNTSAPATFREYNTDQLVEVQSPGHNHKTLITKDGEVAPGEYLDPRGGQIILYDHIRQEVTGSRPISGELDHDVEPFRAAFDQVAQSYCTEHYQFGASTVFGKKEGGQFALHLCLSSFKFNPTNYCNGRWRSQWTVKFPPGGGQLSLQGQIRVNVHYYEDGNVQLTTDTPKQANVPGGNNPGAVASAAIAAIKKAEQDFHAKVEQSYATLSDTTFKALRRVLPITRTKIEWPKIQTYKVGGDLGKQ
jgi:capping protein alpha